jgi:glycosyltransferase involved in cell wall biosynthesis
VDVIVPSMRSGESLRPLADRIRATAGMPCRVITTGLDASASVNRNCGLKQSAGPVVAMVDDDIEFGPESAGWLRVFADALARPDVVMVSAQLLKPDGSFAYMTGLDDCGGTGRRMGETGVPTRRLLTACCAFKPHGLTFDERYVGSGFEDVDFCNQLAEAVPAGVFLVCHAALAIHRNEAKNQRGEFWRRNEAAYLEKWGIK